METETIDRNLATYRRPEVASHYAALDYLSPCELLLFRKYLHTDHAVLDIGVGGGRTSAYLGGSAATYVGIDCSGEMIAACRRRFPHLCFREADAADLSCFSNSCFNAVVITFNGIDYLSTHERRRCLEECLRVLAPRGVLIFSSHNPRALVVRPSWNRDRLRGLSERVRHGTVRWCAYHVLDAAAALRAICRASCGTFGRALRRLPTRMFWRGVGTMVDPAHGGLITRYAVPREVVLECQQVGFQLREIQGDDYPARSRLYFTDWYYYVCVKP